MTNCRLEQRSDWFTLRQPSSSSSSEPSSSSTLTGSIYIQIHTSYPNDRTWGGWEGVPSYWTDSAMQGFPSWPCSFHLGIFDQNLMSRVLFVALCTWALDTCYQINFPIQGLVLNSQPNLKLFNQLYWVVTTAIAQCDKRGHFRFSWKKGIT